MMTLTAVRATVRRPRSFLVTMLAMVVLTASCSSPGPGDDQESSPPTTATATVDGLIDAFAGAGIQTFDKAGDSRPTQAVDAPGAMSLTRWQVDTMTTHLNDHRGYVGRDLDALAGGDVPISIVLAAYLTAAETPGADAARDLMGEQDYAHLAQDIVYPDAVVAIFVNDIASDSSGARPDGTTTPAVLRPGVAMMTRAVAYQAGICTTLSNFLTGSLDSIVSALQIDAQDGVSGILASIWNTVVSIAASAAQLLLSALTAPVINAVKGAISILAVLSSASSLLVPWGVGITASANPTTFGVDPAPGNDVEVRAHVETGADFKWPADLVDCASNAGIVLPDPGSAKDSPIEWNYRDLAGVTKEGAREGTIDEAGDATLQFTTLTESQEAADKGALIVSKVTVAPDIKRTAITKLTDLLASLLLDQLPGPVRVIVDQLLGPVKGKAQMELADLLKVSGQVTSVDVEHHGPPPDDPVPPGEEPPSEDCAVSGPTQIPDGVFKGPIVMDVRGQGGGFDGSADSVGKGTMTVYVKDGKVTGGNWSVGWRSIGNATSAGISTHIDITGKISGSVAGNAQTPFLKGSWSIDGFATVSIGGGKLPLNFSGNDTEKVTVESTSCDEVTGTFIPSFNSKGGSDVTFSGKARWTGSRVN